MRSGEVSAAVVAFESAAGFGVVGGGVLGVVGGGVGVGGGGGGGVVGGVVGEFNAEELEGFVFERGRRRRADKRKLGERVDVHEVMSLSTVH